MILGTEPRVRTMVQLAERDGDADRAEQQTSPARDRGQFLAPRLYPEAASSVASESM